MAGKSNIVVSSFFAPCSCLSTHSSMAFGRVQFWSSDNISYKRSGKLGSDLTLLADKIDYCRCHQSYLFFKTVASNCHRSSECSLSLAVAQKLAVFSEESDREELSSFSIAAFSSSCSNSSCSSNRCVRSH